MARFSGSSPIRAAICAVFLAACAGPAESEWRAIAPDNLLILETEHGRTLIELNSEFAPAHSARMRDMARSGAFDNTLFYRVIDGFVAQGGLQADGPVEAWPGLDMEAERVIGDQAFAPLGNGDLFAPEVGHLEGFPAARDPERGREWLLHCPGAVAMARSADPASAGTEFYITLGAQRYLDRNLTVFGRVISGMAHIQALKRGDQAVAGGVIQPPEEGDKILSIKLASDLPEAERPHFDRMRTESPEFARYKRGLRHRAGAFFVHEPPAILDICNVSVPVREN